MSQMSSHKSKDKLDQVVARAHRELTVHHRDHNHDNNPKDGSNWEWLCIYCHDNEHSNLVDAEHSVLGASDQRTQSNTGVGHFLHANAGQYWMQFNSMV